MKALRVAALLVLSFAAGGGGTELALRARTEVARVRQEALAGDPRVLRLAAARRPELVPAPEPRLVGYIELEDGTRLVVFELPRRCPGCDLSNLRITGA